MSVSNKARLHPRGGVRIHNPSRASRRCARDDQAFGRSGQRDLFHFIVIDPAGIGMNVAVYGTIDLAGKVHWRSMRQVTP